MSRHGRINPTATVVRVDESEPWADPKGLILSGFEAYCNCVDYISRITPRCGGHFRDACTCPVGMGYYPVHMEA